MIKQVIVLQLNYLLQLVECAGPGGSVEVVQNFLDRELIAVTAYYGELVNSVE